MRSAEHHVRRQLPGVKISEKDGRESHPYLTCPACAAICKSRAESSWISFQPNHYHRRSVFTEFFQRPQIITNWLLIYNYIIIKISIKITFEEAKTVFYDEYALIINDPEHSKDIDRREGANMEKEYD